MIMSEIRLAAVGDIPSGEGRVFQVDGEKIAVFRARDGEFYAVQAECPHRGGPLADGLLGGSTLICPLHGWKFDLKTGQALFGECGLKTFDIRLNESQHLVLVK